MAKSKVVSSVVSSVSVAPVLAPVAVAVALPSFDATARTIVKSAISTSKAIDQWIDACVAAGVARSIQNAELVRLTVANSKVLLDAVASNAIKADTLTEYAAGASRAFYHACAWSASLKNDQRKKIPDVQGLVKIAGGKKVTVAENLALCDEADAKKAAEKEAKKTGAVLPVAPAIVPSVPVGTPKKTTAAVINDASMQDALREALRQVRVMRHDEAAADILDTIWTYFPSFVEDALV